MFFNKAKKVKQKSLATITKSFKLEKEKKSLNMKMRV